jgi:putative tryptophan/tyrosine transport system substrate-binding protein
MNKKILIAIIVIVVLAAIGAYFFINAAKTKKTEKVYHIGILSGLNNSIIIGDTFIQDMANLGYIEGKNIVYDYQKTNFEPDKEKQILDKFVADKVDLIFGFNTDVGLEAKAATKGTNIPVIFAMGIIEGNDLVDSVHQPGGNITGVRYPGVDFSLKRFEILHEIIPNAKRIWIPYQKGYPSASYELEVLRPVAASLGITLIEFPADNLAALQAELERRSNSGDMGFDAVLYIPESLSTTKDAFDIIAKFTRERKIPIGGTKIISGDYGTIFSASIYYPEEGKLAASLADKILKGTQAGTISVVSPEPYLIINYKVAQELGLTISEGLLSQADEIIR